MSIFVDIPVRANLKVDLVYEDRVVRHHEGHNILTNIGKQFLAESITASALSSGAFTRTIDEVVRYIGFGIGGSRQTADTTALDATYPGSNTQTDLDVTVTGLERPVQLTSGGNWMAEIAAPGTFPAANSTKFISSFAKTDINFGTFTDVPISEIALFKSGADPSLANGAAGAYPGAGGHAIAYDTFSPIHKTGLFSIIARWTFRF